MPRNGRRTSQVKQSRGVLYSPRRPHSRRSHTATAAAYLGLCLPLSPSLALEPRRHPPSCHRKTYLAIPARRQPRWTRSGTGFLLYLRSLSQPVYRDLAARAGRALGFADLLHALRVSRHRHPARCAGHRARHLQPDHRRRHQRQAHLWPGRSHLVRFGRLLRNSGQPQCRL